MNDLHRNRTLAFVLLTGFAVALLWALGARALVPPDEGRYAEMAREMFASGDWVTTRLNGIKYFEKPPLQTWMNALTFTVFGVGEWQARLWTGLCGLSGVVLTGFAGTRVFGPRVGFYAALVLGSSFYWVACSQVDSLDMGLSGMTTLALCALLVAQRNDAAPGERRNWMLVCWAGMALAVLSKGLIGVVLPGGVLAFYTLVARDRAVWKRLHAGKGLLLFLLIAAPWFVLVALRNPEQPEFFFIHEHVERFLLKEHRREGAWWLFFGLVAAGSVPWAGVLLQSLVLGARSDNTTDADAAGGSGTAARVAPGPFKPRLLLLVWVVFITLFFTASNSKLPGYIVPVFPAVALLVGHYLEAGARRGRMLTAASTALLGAGLLVLVPNAERFASRPGEDVLYAAYQPWILAAGLVLLIGGALAMLTTRQLKRDLTVLVLALAGFTGTELMLAGFDPIGQARAGTALLPAMRAAGAADPAVKVYSIAHYEQSLTFYLGRTVTLVAYLDEFAFGLKQEPHLAVPTAEAFYALWRADALAGRRNLAITSPAMFEQMRREGLLLRIVARDARRVVVANG